MSLIPFECRCDSILIVCRADRHAVTAVTTRRLDIDSSTLQLLKQVLAMQEAFEPITAAPAKAATSYQRAAVDVKTVGQHHKELVSVEARLGSVGEMGEGVLMGYTHGLQRNAVDFLGGKEATSTPPLLAAMLTERQVPADKMARGLLQHTPHGIARGGPSGSLAHHPLPILTYPSASAARDTPRE